MVANTHQTGTNNKRCNTCGRMNHFSRCCRSGKPFAPNRPGQVPPPAARRGRYTHVSELDTQPLQEPNDVFHCETVEMFYCESIDKPEDVREQDERFAELSAFFSCGLLRFQVVDRSTNHCWVSETVSDSAM